MQNAFETFESRTLLSASVSSKSHIQTIGQTSGLVAAAATPSFGSLSVTSTTTGSTAGTSNADLDTAIKITIIPATGHGGIDATNLIRAAVRLTNVTTGKVYRSSDSGTLKSELQRLKTSGGGDVLIIQALNPLDANNTYRVEVNGTYATSSVKVRDVEGALFSSFTGTFTTGSYLAPAPAGINFTQATQNAAGTKPFVATTVGPDHRLYASTTDGYIYRYDLGSDGTLSNEFQISTVRNHNGGARIITGITFDPGSTANNLALWVSHNQYRFGNNPNGSDDVQKYADNFTGKISVISGSNLQDYQDKIINIPRSVKDHMNNQIVFDPKGKNLYFGIAGLNAMGAADSTWGNRVENIYSASITRAVVGALNIWVRDKGPVNLGIDMTNNDPSTQTGLVPGTLHYNIYKGSNPVRLFATGVRNAFDMVFASNGHLYADINGSSAGGNVPATPAFSSVPIQNRIDKDLAGRGTYNGPSSPALNNVRQTEEDALLDVKEGAYYGHPNPSRGEYIFDGANPTSAADPFEISSYPVGQQPDRNYNKPIWDYGTNFSPDGIIQYKAVNGRNTPLDGALVAARYSGGGDLLGLTLNPKTGGISNTLERIQGFTQLGSPLDVTEDLTNGNLYVTTLQDEVSTGSIILLKPQSASNFMPVATAYPTQLGFLCQARRLGGHAAGDDLQHRQCRPDV